MALHHDEDKNLNMKRECSVCGKSKKETVHHQKFGRFDDGIIFNYVVVECKKCGAVFADETPPQEVYDAYYHDMSKYEELAEESKVSPDLRSAHERVSVIVDGFLRNKNVKILDIGCATGDTLFEFKRKGYARVCGIDPAPRCKKIAKQLYDIDIETATLKTWNPIPGSYDVITLSHVLEHLVDVKGSIEKMYQALGEKGLLYIEVPAAHQFIKRPEGFEHFSMEHVNYYSPKTLTSLMMYFGFTEKYIKTEENKQGLYPYFPVITSVWEKKNDRVLVGGYTSELKKPIRSYVDNNKQSIKKVVQKIASVVRAKTPIIIWGAGSHTLKLFAYTNIKKADIVAIVDDTKRLQGKRIEGINIQPHTSVIDTNATILISSTLSQEKIKQRIQNDLGLINSVLTLY